MHYAPIKGTIAPVMSTMPGTDQLATTLFGKTRRTVLALLYSHVDESFYLRQLTRMAGVGMGAVQRELKALVDAGIINRKVQGRQTYFQANHQSPVFEELKSLIIKTVGVGDVLRAALAPLAERIDVAFIYGSIAEIVSALSRAEETLRREINPTIYPRTEFLTKVRAGHHFVSTVLHGDKIFLIGDQDGLRKLVKKQLAGRTQKQPSRNR